MGFFSEMLWEAKGDGSAASPTWPR
jgi:hypothetical protein